MTFSSSKSALVNCSTCVMRSVPETRTKLCNQSHSVYLSLEKSFCSLSFEERKCWKCGAETNTKKELFFCNCGVVQEVPSDLRYFEVINFTKSR